MRIICPVKRVPDTAANKVIDPDDKTLDRDAGEAILNANDEWSIEEAMRIKERGNDAQIIALCMGPEQAQTTVRKALSYGLDGAIQITDPAVHGSDFHYFLYKDEADCLDQCSHFWPGVKGATEGDSVGCREYHAGNPALSDPDLHCPHAGPGGGGVCAVQ